MSNERIVGEVKQGIELDIKRCYLPGVAIEGECPECNEPWRRDLSRAYLSYPRVGEPSNVYGHCMKCDADWLVMVTVNVVLELAKPNT